MASIRLNSNPTGTTLTANDLFVIVQNGVDKVVPFSTLSSLISGGTSTSISTVTGGTYNGTLLTLNKSDNTNVVITGITNTYTTGATLTSDGTFTLTDNKNNTVIVNGLITNALYNPYTANTQTLINNNTSAIATLNSATKKRFGKYSNKNIVAWGSKLPYEAGRLSNGVMTEETSKFMYKAIGRCSNITNLFFNFDPINVTTPTSFNDITVEATVEQPVGVYNRITFNGGSNSVLIKKGFYVESDVWKFNISADTVFAIHTKVSVNPGEFFLKNNSAFGGNALGIEGGISGNGLTTTIGSSTGYYYGCSAILGISDTKNGSIIYKGDSISCGLYDSTGSYYTSNLSGGLFFRAFGFNYPVLMTNIPGQKASNYDKNTSINVNNFDELFTGAQFSISNLSVNDLSISSLAQIQAYVIGIWYTDKASGIGIYHSTCTPQTTSTDNWSSLSGQTVMGFESKRIGFNDWLRDGAPIDYTSKLPVTVGASGLTISRMGNVNHPALGYIEVADTLETSRNSGKWKTNGTAFYYTVDGLHPAPNGYALAYIPIAALEATGAFKV